MLSLEGVGLTFGSHAVLVDVSLELADGEVVSLLGPSGSGKTSLLRVVAGLQAPTEGRVLLAGRDLGGVPPHRRGVGLMFQDYALFPHRDVAGNVAFGLRMQGLPAEAVRSRVADVLDLVGLPGTQERAVASLSGGEQQRVALARALAPRPSVLMLDEPMGSLDRSLRERLPEELRRIFQTLAVTVIYVTHDQDEALAVADRTVILNLGRVEADAPSERLWMEPPTAFVARFLGGRNVCKGSVGGGRVNSPWGVLDSVAAAATAQGPVTLAFRPGAVTLHPEGQLEGRVSARRFRGDHALLMVQVVAAASTVPLEVEARGNALPGLGDPVRVRIDPAGVVLLPPERGQDGLA
jgi:thiamine transport system ATP-binding protein